MRISSFMIGAPVFGSGRGCCFCGSDFFVSVGSVVDACTRLDVVSSAYFSGRYRSFGWST